MPESPHPEKRRVAYHEWRDTYDKLTRIGERRRCPVLEVIRDATDSFVKAWERDRLPKKQPMYAKEEESALSGLRISHREWADVYEKIAAIAAERRITVSQVIRWATLYYCDTVGRHYGIRG